jgi:uncharacterized damage-inducible protein DinB
LDEFAEDRFQAKPFKGTWKWLQMMTEHEAHHRGQIYSMLGFMGVPSPPLYGLTSQEVRRLAGGG